MEFLALGSDDVDPGAGGGARPGRHAWRARAERRQWRARCGREGARAENDPLDRAQRARTLKASTPPAHPPRPGDAAGVRRPPRVGVAHCVAGAERAEACSLPRPCPRVRGRSPRRWSVLYREALREGKDDSDASLEAEAPLAIGADATCCSTRRRPRAMLKGSGGADCRGAAALTTHAEFLGNDEAPHSGPARTRWLLMNKRRVV